MKSIHDKRIFKNHNLGQVASAARKTLRYLSQRDLDDVGLYRSAFVDGVVEIVRTDIYARELDEQMSKIIKSVINPKLVGAV
tara:strand:+ start:620 stop:865 length:246 start_codon:yes stop_codon:yes gene_type:complete